MSVTFTTDAVLPRDRVEFWHSASCSTYIEYDCRVQSKLGFQARIEAAQLGDLTLSVCDNTPLVADRTRRHVARSDSDSVFFGVLLGGSKHIEQDGREVMITAGDCYLVDAGRPYVLTCNEPKSELVLEIPRPQLEARIGCSASARASLVSGRKGAGAFAASYLRHLQKHLELVTSSTTPKVVDQAVDLVSLALTNSSPATVRRLASATAVSRLRLHDAIDANVPHRRIQCADIADMAGISRRYANFLLAQEGTSLERLLVDRRLERSRILLADPSNRPRTIAEIAMASGFDSASHFSRSFKEAYGLTARDYRHVALGGPDHRTGIAPLQYA